MNSGSGSVNEFSDQPFDTGDADVLTAIGALYGELDPVPEGMAARLKFAVSLAEMQAELAHIQELAGELTGARSDDVETARTISFAASSVTIVVTLSSASADHVRVDGWLSPAAPMQVELRLADERRDAVADHNGRFVFDEVGNGRATLIVRAHDAARPVATPSFDL